MKLKDMTDQDLFEMGRQLILTDEKIPHGLIREIKRRKALDPQNAFDFLKPPPETKRPSVRLTLTNRECNILLGELYSSIQAAKDWLRDHPDVPSNPMIERRMGEKVTIANKLRDRLGN